MIKRVKHKSLKEVKVGDTVRFMCGDTAKVRDLRKDGDSIHLYFTSYVKSYDGETSDTDWWYKSWGQWSRDGVSSDAPKADWDIDCIV